MRLAACVLVGFFGAGACGRIGFDPPGLAGDDTNGDARANGDGASGDGVTSGTPQLVDSGHLEPGSTNQLGVSLPGAVQPGDVIIVSVGFRDATTNITSVTDDRGNVYSREAQTNRSNGAVSQECMVAIAATAAPNIIVLVMFSQVANLPSVRVLVYRGVSTAQAIQPQNGGGANTQNMSAATLSLKAGSIILGTNTADRAGTVGSGFNLILMSDYNEIVETKVVANTGFQTVTGTLMTPGNWVMEAIALPPL